MQEFFRGGFQADPGEAGGGLPEFFQIPGRAQPRFLVASMVKMEELSGQGAIASNAQWLTPLTVALSSHMTNNTNIDLLNASRVIQSHSFDYKHHSYLACFKFAVFCNGERCKFYVV